MYKLAGTSKNVLLLKMHLVFSLFGSLCYAVTAPANAQFIFENNHGSGYPASGTYESSGNAEPGGLLIPVPEVNGKIVEKTTTGDKIRYCICYFEALPPNGKRTALYMSFLIKVASKKTCHQQIPVMKRYLTAYHDVHQFGVRKCDFLNSIPDFNKRQASLREFARNRKYRRIHVKFCGGNDLHCNNSN